MTPKKKIGSLTSRASLLIHVIWAQETKTMEETGDGFKRNVLAYFDLISIFNQDNGLRNSLLIM